MPTIVLRNLLLISEARGILLIKAWIHGRRTQVFAWQEGVDMIDSYHQTSKISGTLLGNKIVGHSDVVGTSPVGATPTTYSFST